MQKDNAEFVVIGSQDQFLMQVFMLKRYQGQCMVQVPETRTLWLRDELMSPRQLRQEDKITAKDLMYVMQSLWWTDVQLAR